MQAAPSVGSELITRRTALERLGAAAVLGALPGALRAREATPPDDDFTFIVINDTHYQTPECGRWLEGIIRQMRAEQPAFCLHLGDLVDVGSRENHLAVREVFIGLGVPVYVQIGNHDYTTQTDRSAYDEIHPGRVNYRFEHHGWHFLGVDSTEGLHWSNTKIPGSTFEWVDAELARIPANAPVVLFTHFPLAEGVKFRPLNAADLLDRFRAHNLQAVYNGHFHGFTEHSFGPAVVTTDRCCSLQGHNHDHTPEKGYFVCRANQGRITRRFVEVTVPAVG